MIDIKDFEGLYAITEDGKVWSYRRQIFLKPNKEIDNYLSVTLSKDNKGYPRKVHRLVAEAYIPNPDNLPQVNHKDEDPTNNNVNNLEWCTPKYNANYGTRNKKLSDLHKKPVLCIELNKIFDSVHEANLWCNSTSVSDCCRGKLKTTGGYHWKYV